MRMNCVLLIVLRFKMLSSFFQNPKFYTKNFRLIQISKVVFGKSAVLQETSNLIVDVFAELRSVAVLQFKLADKHALELLALLDIHQALTTSLAHA